MHIKPIEYCRYTAIFLTAAAALPLYQGFADKPETLFVLILLAIAAAVLPDGFGGIAGPAVAGVWLGLMALFGFFGIFQIYRIIVAFIRWINAVLTNFYQMMGM